MLLPEKQQSPSLTPRELEILTLILEGNSNREIAAKLHLSLPTVKEYCSRLYRKFNVKNRSKLLACFMNQETSVCQKYELKS
ncbi:MAG: response regulator transcription factor [Peptococcaceae bacterium]|nr:response regulator transcription factor [Peptococcaceae bacterium]